MEYVLIIELIKVVGTNYPIFRHCLNSDSGYREILNIEEYLRTGKAELSEQIYDGHAYIIRDSKSLSGLGRML